jgi:hypothetical protein
MIRPPIRGVMAHAFLLEFALGSAALAVWIDARFSARTPETARTTLLHVGVAVLAVQLMPPAVRAIVGGDYSPERKMAAAFVAALPILTYAWLASIWVLKLVQRVHRLR